MFSGILHSQLSHCPNHGPINHGLATPFISYRVTLNARKTRDFIRYLIILQSYKLGPLRQCSDSQIRCQHARPIFSSHITWRKNFVMCVLPLVRHVFLLGNYNFASSLRVGAVEIIVLTCPTWFLLLNLIFPTTYIQTNAYPWK